MSRAVLVAGLMLVALGCSDAKKGAVYRDAALTGRQAEGAAAQAPAVGRQNAPPAPPERKIIYAARIELHVANLDDTRGKLAALLTEMKGFVA